MTQAAMGAHITIDTLHGPEDLVVPAGTQPGRVFRFRGKGVPSLRTGRRGDLLVEAQVEIPARLSDEEAELLTRFAGLRGEEVEPLRAQRLLSRFRSPRQ